MPWDQSDFYAAEEAWLQYLEVARQLRGSFYGAEALRQQRGRNEVKVLARLPRSERSQLNSVEDLVLRTPTGGVPLYEETRSLDVVDGLLSANIGESAPLDPTLFDNGVDFIEQRTGWPCYGVIPWLPATATRTRASALSWPRNSPRRICGRPRAAACCRSGSDVGTAEE